MSQSSLKIVSIVIAVAMSLSTLAFLGAPQSFQQAEPSLSQAAYVPITISNNLPFVSSVPYVQQLSVNSSMYASLENANLSNVYFTYPNGTMIYSWLETGNSNSSNDTVYFLKLDAPIMPLSSLEVFMNFLPVGHMAFNPITTGEAPQLTSKYAQYDNGKNIFPLYDNFAGSSLNTSMWNYQGYVKVHNGLNMSNITVSSSQIYSKATFAAPFYIEAYGLINGSINSGSKGNYMNGVGFDQSSGISGGPAMSTGWAQNTTNGFGMTIFNGTNGGNPNISNISKLANPLQYHVFGVGHISNDLTTTVYDNAVVNHSDIKLGISNSTGLNATIGYQSGNIPKGFIFDWVFVRTSTIVGELYYPYSVGSPIYRETFTPLNLNSNVNWTLNIDSSTYTATGSSNISLLLPYGVYDYTVSTDSIFYQPNAAKGVLDITEPGTTMLGFTELYNLTLKSNYLPPGTPWAVSINNVLKNTTGNMINFTLAKGYYNARISSPSGYIAYPDNLSIQVSSVKNTATIDFESPANQTYLKSDFTLTSNFQNIVPGYYLNYSLSPVDPLSTIAVNTTGNQLFGASPYTNQIFTRGISSGISGYVNYPDPGSMFFDNHNGKLYALSILDKNLTEINPTSLTNISNTHIPWLGSYNAYFILNGPSNSTLYVVGIDSYSAGNMTVSTIGLNGDVISTVNFTGLDYSTYSLGPLVGPTSYNGYLYMPNGTGIMSFDISTGIMKYIKSPSNYTLSSLIPYGNTGTFLMGNDNGTSDMLFDPGNMSFERGPNIPGFAIVGLYDNITNQLYVEWNPNVSAGISYGTNLSVINLNNNRVVAAAPFPSISVSGAIDPALNQLYLNDYPYEPYTFEVRAYSIAPGYKATFEANGLPSGSQWYVNITNEQSSGPISSGAAYTITLNNGTYQYSIGSSNKDYSASAGVFKVIGNGVYTTVQFKAITYNVTFEETGLPNDTLWSFILNGQTYRTTSSTYSIAEFNGTYSYGISNVSGYTVGINATRVVVDGNNVTVLVTFKHNSTSPAIPPDLIYGIMGVGAVAVISGISYSILRKRKG